MLNPRFIRTWPTRRKCSPAEAGGRRVGAGDGVGAEGRWSTAICQPRHGSCGAAVRQGVEFTDAMAWGSYQTLKPFARPAPASLPERRPDKEVGTGEDQKDLRCPQEGDKGSQPDRSDHQGTDDEEPTTTLLDHLFTAGPALHRCHPPLSPINMLRSRPTRARC